MSRKRNTGQRKKSRGVGSSQGMSKHRRSGRAVTPKHVRDEMAQLLKPEATSTNDETYSSVAELMRHRHS